MPNNRVKEGEMIKVYCRKCNKELDEQGGLVFSIPDGMRVSKSHICRECHSGLISWMDNLPEKNVIKLTAAEIQSGHDRVRWAEGLIKQLPKEHDGRNSWLFNYGSDEKKFVHEMGNASLEDKQKAGEL